MLEWRIDVKAKLVFFEQIFTVAYIHWRIEGVRPTDVGTWLLFSVASKLTLQAPRADKGEHFTSAQ